MLDLYCNRRHFDRCRREQRKYDRASLRQGDDVPQLLLHALLSVALRPHMIRFARFTSRACVW